MELTLTYSQSNDGKTLTLTDGSSWGVGNNPALANIISVIITMKHTATGTVSTVISETATDWTGSTPTQAELAWDVDVDSDSTFGTEAFTDDIFDDNLYYLTYTILTDDVGAATANSSNSGTSTLTSGGTYSGTTTDYLYTVEIDGNGTPDTFKWKNEDTTDGSWEAETVSITEAAQTLEDGVTITFDSNTTSADEDSWTFTASPTAVLSTSFFLYYTVNANIAVKLSELPYEYTDEKIAYNETVQHDVLCVAFLSALERGGTIGYVTESQGILDTLEELTIE